MRACNCARASPFQSRTCVGCDLVILYQRDVLPVVSIHAPAWGATQAYGPLSGADFEFQSTHPRGVRRSSASNITACMCCFNPRTRVGCDVALCGWEGQQYMFQSTHPRGVRRPDPAYPAGWSKFQSTHPRGVRLRRLGLHHDAIVFQSTHPRGVRHEAGASTGLAWKFQSTHPRGVRHRAGPVPARPDGVSIHAPAWGATGREPVPCHCRRGFNPRTRVGCDVHRCRCGQGVELFQSTHPRGVRRPCPGARGRTPVFQSTHPRGVRPGRCRPARPRPRVSIHAPAWGATRNPRSWRCASSSFNPRTRVGCDTASMSVLSTVREFQSTHPRGVRPHEFEQPVHAHVVSIHAPAWGATLTSAA